MKLVTVAEMQAVERQADAHGLSYAQMMQNAGANLARAVQAAYDTVADKSALGLVGSGNNGGDTLVALAFLAARGWQTAAYAVRSRPADDPLVVQLLAAGGQYVAAWDDPGCRQLASLLGEYSLVLDGVLGTGVRLPLRPEVADVLGLVKETVNALEHPPYIVAVDCPSGVDCDCGQAAPETLPADLTVTMAAVKQGLLRFPAFGLLGDLRLVGIGNLAGLPAWEQIRRFVVDAAWVRSRLPARPLDAHKGTFGAALVVAGSLNYSGAALLAGEAAYRIGAGWVTLAVPASLHAALAGQLPEATWVLLPEENGFIAAAAADVLREQLERPTALLIGPGLGLQQSTGNFLADFLPGFPSETSFPALVIDADGLKLLAWRPDWPSRLPAPAVLTPHPGEMAILTGLAGQEVQADRIGVAERYAARWGHVVVLKGAGTVIAAPDGRTAVIAVATPALARAGTGDVLAGMIAGLRAQGLDAFEAAAAGAWIHAQAGLRAAESLGSTAAVLAGDVLAGVVGVVGEMMKTHPHQAARP
ncbi:MAG: NAD(P)H-hydrate dehydratase [Chloroflexota bacterium]